MTYQQRQQERLRRRIEELRAWRNARESVIPDWTFTASDRIPISLELGDFWPVIETPVSVSTIATIPPAWAGEPVELELWLGGEGFVQLSTGYRAGLNPMHHRFPVVERAAGGESITIDVELVPKGIFGSAIAEPRLERAQFVVPHREVRALERDLAMLLAATEQLGENEVVQFLLVAAEQAISELAVDWPTNSNTAVTRYVLGYDNGIGGGTGAVPPDWVPEAIDAQRPTQPTWSLPPASLPLEPLSDDAILSVNRAREVLYERLQAIKADYPPIGRLCLTGHAHVDLAWLWPLAETRRKTRRTFSTVLDLMDRYPDFTFNQSSAQAYAWIEKDDPDVLTRIKSRVAEGRWEPIGGMWVESDANITGGEAFARQLIYGQRYFERTFGRRNTVAWLPDVFGYSGGMPQLFRGAGVTGFFTIKLNWNEANQFPFDLFEWEGIDGTSVTAHTFFNPGHGYNGNIVPLDTLGTWRNFRGKTLHNESLLAFGWGDGAGGPTEKMLENYARIKDFPGLPRLRMGSIQDYYDAIPADALPRYSGELYLELHRGTLTTQAKTKALNRASEHRLLEAEAFGAIASLAGFRYPAEQIETAWKTLLLNQFHDILPGSSINEVYQDTHRLLGEVVETAIEVRDAALSTMDTGSSTDFLVANAGLNPRPLQIVLTGIEGNAGISAENGATLATQPTEGGLLVHGSGSTVPGLGWIGLQREPNRGSAPIANSVRAEKSGERISIENALLNVAIGSDGTIQRLFDKQAGRDALAGRGNQLWAYVDKPYTYDAWDIDETYWRDGAEIGDVQSIEVVETGPLRASVRVTRSWRESTISQTYRLWADSRRLDFETEIEWRQRQVLLKAKFPLAVHTHEATFETMFGAVQRPTHRNTPFDAAQFEVCGHRFADMSEPGYGVAVLNNAKYGYEALGNVLMLSLLRSPLYPDPLADEGMHSFTYSLYPHPGDWTESEVVNEAFWLNSPLISLAGPGETRSFVSVEGLRLGLGSLKPAFDGHGLVLRLYEPHGARGESTLRFSEQVESAERVNLLEEPETGVSQPKRTDDSSFSILVRPFEIISVRLTMKEKQGFPHP